MELPIPPRRALAVMAHPDDIEFMAGGLVSRWARAGVELHYCLLTDGNSGSRDPHASPVDLAIRRRDEQRAAGGLVNVQSYHFLGRTDGRLVADMDLRLAIARVIRATQPDAVITCDPQFFYEAAYLNHPDHRAAAEATFAAIMPIANTRLAAPELLADGLEPHDVSEVYIAAPARATLWVPVGPEDLARQVAMMRAHASQIGDWDFESLLRTRASAAAEQARANGIDCEMAEEYVYVNLKR
ncbi:MAG TPA: PIG-L deacetylase family protein [Roseiflexaceae bacterium]|nr:PIG-L deacetylase family protein [Roseiflexaceae bacterium]